MEYFCAVDVGTGSARAAIVDENGSILGTSVSKTQTWAPKPDFYQQSSEDIWRQICKCVKEALQKAKIIDPALIKGICFDATCSLVLLDENKMPVSVSEGEEEEQNIILWMDHRAIEEANFINSTKHKVLENVGGTISPEMETPKLLWLKKNKPKSFKKARYFLDLADFLVFKATDEDVRSLCTTVCKWTFQHPGGWDLGFFKQIVLIENDNSDDFVRCIGTTVREVGEAVGKGLTDSTAAELGLNPNTVVSTALIDAHAGGIGLLGASDCDVDICEQMAIISGTSSCHMCEAPESVVVEGVWGPYPSAMVPGLVLTEGGQSATGALLDHVVESHIEGARLKEKYGSVGMYAHLNDRLRSLATENGLESIDYLTKDLHIQPDFHGNRSPLADPTIRGQITGMSLDSSLDSLAVLYLATVQGLAYGTKAIIDAINAKRSIKGVPIISSLVMCGGLSKNAVFVEAHATICQCTIALPLETEAVLVGSAVSAAVASKRYPSFQAAMKKMCHSGSLVQPNKRLYAFHTAKNAVFKLMYTHQAAYRSIMDNI